MKGFYNPGTDTLTLIFKDNIKEGDLVSLEILDASNRVTETRRVDFQVTGQK